MLRDSPLLPCPLCFQEAQETLGGHPCPSCHPAPTLLCTLLLGGLSFRGAPCLLLVLLGLAPQEAQGFGGRNPRLQVAPVHLWHLEAQGALACLESQVNPSPQEILEVQVAPVVPGIQLVLSGHLVHHILGSLCVLEGLGGPGGPGDPADPGLLVPLSEGQHSQGGPGARVLLLGHRGREVPDRRGDLGQECHLQELFLWHLRDQVIQVSLGGRGDLFLQEGLGEKFLGSRGLLSPLSAQVCPLGQVGPLHANLKRLWLLSDPLNHASRSDRATRRDLLFQEDLVSPGPPSCLLAQDPPCLLDVPSAQVLLDHLGSLVVRRSQVVLAFQVVLWALEHPGSPALQVLQDVLDIQGYLVLPRDQVGQTD